MFNSYFNPMRKFLRLLNERALPSRWGPPLMLALFFVLTRFGAFAQTDRIPIADGDFSNGATFTANGWTVSNNLDNSWQVGTAHGLGAPFAGNAAFISTTGATYDYSGANTLCYFYRDVTVPIGEPIMNLQFNWRQEGEVFSGIPFDLWQVFVAPITVNPIATTTYPGGGAANVPAGITGATYIGNGLPTASIQTFNGVVPASFAGTTFRLIFAWKNDVDAFDPPAALDNIRLISTAPANFNATAQGGLWNSPATWALGVVPASGNDITIPAGSHVMIDQALNYRNLTINGTLSYAVNLPTAAASAVTVSGNLTVGATGRFHIVGPTLALNSVNMTGGNFVNNGFVNASAAILVWPPTAVGNYQISGTGTWTSSGGRGLIRVLSVQTSGTFTINTSADLTATNQLIHTSNTLVTNNKLRVDNSAGIFDADISVAIVTNMGAGYTTAPVVAGTLAANWDAVATPPGVVRVNAGHQYVSLDAIVSVDAPTHTTFNVVAGADGKEWLHVGPVGRIGNALGSPLTPLAANQYFYNGGLFTTVTSALMTPANISAATPFTPVVGTDYTIGTAVLRCVGTSATVSLNYSAGTQTVRSANVATAGSGYAALTPTFEILNTGAGTSAAGVAIKWGLLGATVSNGIKASASTITGSINIPSSTGTVGASVSSLINVISGVYISAPSVGFAAPTRVNLVQAQGTGFSSATTIDVSGGTLISGAAMVAADFQVNVAQGRVISVYYTGSLTKIYSVPPTLAITTGGGAGATVSWGPGDNAWPTATANLNAAGQIASYTVTNAGYGYVAATAVVSPFAALSAPGAGEAAATTPVVRIGVHTLQQGFFTPQTTNPYSTFGAMMPGNNRVGAIISTSGCSIGANTEVFGETPLTLTSVIDLGGFTLRASSFTYVGQITTVGGFLFNGTVELSLPGGQATAIRTFPLGGGTGAGRYGVYNTGAGTDLATLGYTFTGIRATTTGAPSGTVNPSGNMTGVRGMRLQMQGTGVLSNTNPLKTFQLFWNQLDNLVSDNPSIYVAQAAALAGPWELRSASSGVGALPNTGSRTTATTGFGPIANISDNFFAFANSGFVAPPPLAYNVVRTNAITYNSIAPVSLGGDGSGLSLGTWTGSDDAQLLVSVVDASNAFSYQGELVTGLRVGTNGFIQLQTASAATTSTAFTNDLALTSALNVLSPFWEDLTTQPNTLIGVNNCIRYRIDGTAPNRTVIVEWANMGLFGLSGPQIAFQVRMVEATGAIIYDYGDIQMFNGTQNVRYSYSLGLKGRYNNIYPQAGQVFALEFENTNLFSHLKTQIGNLGSNGMLISPEPRSRYTFTPGAYVPPAPPVPTAPANNTAGTADLITSLVAFPANVSYNIPDAKSRIYTTRNATTNGPAPCAGPATARDVWFRFVANEPNITVRIYPSGGYMPRVTVYNDDLSSTLACVAGTNLGASVDAILTGLTIGNTFRVRVAHNFVGTPAVYTANAVVNGTIVGVAINDGGTNIAFGSTSSPGGNGPRNIATGGGGNNYVGTATGPSNAVASVTGGGFDGGNNYVTVPTITSESPDWGLSGEFAIVIYAPPVNDNCDGAIALTGIGGLTCNTGTNQRLGIAGNGATQSPEPTAPCATGPDDDLWYRFTATGTRSKVAVQGNDGYNPALILYNQAAGNCVTKAVVALPANGCVNVTGINGLEDIEFPTVAGEVYFVRVYHAGAGFGGALATFDICVTTLPPVDVAAKSLVNPSSTGSCGSATQDVSIMVWNRGANTLIAGTIINLTANITGAAVANLVLGVALPADLVPNDSVALSVGTFNMTVGGTYNFAIIATSAGDGNAANNNLAAVRTLNLFVVAPNFADGLNAATNWTISQVSGAGNWAFTAGGQLSGEDAPGDIAVPAFEGSGYLFFDSYNFSATTISRAASPCFELPATCSKVTFRFKRDGQYTNADEVRIRVSTNAGASWSAPLNLENVTKGRAEQALRFDDDLAANAFNWQLFETPLNIYVGQTIRVAIDAVGAFGNNMMVDDFRIVPAASIDVQPVALIAPAPNASCGNTTANVTVRFRNNACLAATNIPYTVNISGPASPGVLNGVIPFIAGGAELNVAVGSITITGNSPLGFTINTSLTGDEAPGNNVIGPIIVPLRAAPTVTTTLADQNLVLGFSTTLTGTAVPATPNASFSNATTGAFGTANIQRTFTLSGMGSLAANQITSFSVNLTHAFLADVELYLTDPNGVTRALIVGRGGASSAGLVGTNLVATGGTALAAGTPPYTGNFAPEQSFAGFTAAPGSANGVWVLDIEDNFPALDNGFFLNGTINFPNAVTSNWFCPTCPVGFPASGTTYPNNPLGATYPVGIYSIDHVVSDLSGCVVTNTVSLNVFTTNRWLGINPGIDNWQDPANWQSAPAPPNSLVAVTIPAGTPFSPNINTVGTAGSFNLGNAATVNIALSAFLDVFANWSGGVGATTLGTGNVRFNGPGTQVVNGNTLFNNILFEKTTGNVNIAGKALVGGTMAVSNATSPITVLSGGSLVLVSGLTGTGRIAAVPSGAVINGNVTMERYLDIPADESGRWQFLSTPVTGNNFSDWGSDFRVVGPASSATGSHYGGQASTWNVGDPGRATIFVYDESSHHTRFDTAQRIGWKIAPSGNILPGVGYRVYVDRFTLGAKKKFNNIGSVVTGLVNFPTLSRNEYSACVPASFNCLNSVSDYYRGWNMIGNPYPSDINWDATGVGTWGKQPNMQNNFWRWNAAGNGYGVYVGGSNVWAGALPPPANPNVIPSSQAFFVRLTAPGNYTSSLSVNENAKTGTAAGTFVRTSTEVANRLKLELTKMGDNEGGYRGFVAFDRNNTDAVDVHGDIANLGSNTYNFNFVVDNQLLTYTTFDELNGTVVIPVRVGYVGQTGTYRFKMSDLESFNPGTEVYLRDIAKNVLYSADMGEYYEFQITSANINDRSRFELIFNGEALGIKGSLLNKGLSVFPNPTDIDGSTKVVFNGVSSEGSAIVSLTDLVGKVVYVQSVSVKTEGATEHIINNTLPAGTYTVKVSGNSKTLTTKLVIK